MDPISDTQKNFQVELYAGRELLSMLEGMVELDKFLVDDQVIKKNKLKGITEMILNLNELDNYIRPLRMNDYFPNTEGNRSKQ